MPGGRLNDSVGRHSPGPIVHPEVDDAECRLLADQDFGIANQTIRGEVLHVFRVSVRNNPRIDAVDIDEHVVRGCRNRGHR